MKFLIALSAVVLAVAGLPTPAPPVVIGADNLLLNASRTYAPKNAGLAGFGAGTIGGAGGSVWTVWDAWALRDAVNTVAPRIIYVRGRIDLTTLFTGSPGVSILVGPFKTIIGADANAEIYGGGLTFINAVHIIIQNIKLTNCISYAPGEQPNGNGGIISQQPGAFGAIDCLDITESQFIWADHLTLSDGHWNAAAIAADRRRHNGLITIKLSSTMITVSNCIFKNHNMNLLIGHDDSWQAHDVGRLKVTFYLNWFQGTNQRNPMVRFGEVHVLNNLYTDISSYGIGIHTGARVYGEKNYFTNCNRAWGKPIRSEPAVGDFLNVENWLDNSRFDSGIPNNVHWDPNHHYGYFPMDARNVNAHVRQFAGTW